MNILVADGTAAQREATLKCLLSAGHKIDVATSVEEAETLLGAHRYDLLITEADFPERPAEGQSLVRRFRASEKEGHVYILLLAAQLTPMRIAQAFESGCDDVARKPISKEELIGRAGAINRISKWAGSIFSDSGILDWSQKANLTGLRAWHGAATTTSTILSGMFGLAVAPSVAHAEQGTQSGAELSLALADDGGEILLSVGSDASSIERLARAALSLPAPTADEQRDIMKEIANTVGGAFKRLAEGEHVGMTIGLPRAHDALDLRREQPGVISSFSVELGDAIHLHFTLVLRPRSAEWVEVKQLQENMVVIRNVLNSNGMTLVTAGSRLSQSGIEKLIRFLPQETLVHVMHV